MFSFFYYALNIIFLFINPFILTVLLAYLYLFLTGADSSGWSLMIMVFIFPVVLLAYIVTLFLFRKKSLIFKRNSLILSSIPTIGLFLYWFFVKGGLLDNLLI